jgi:DNA (cytosine-5)-methyltransferase 1
MAKAYYNEIDSYAADWLENLIAAGHIAPGDVDRRDIRDVLPSDLDGYTQCHFFAGIGIWSAALRDAGWPDDRPIWTGSCPCQPFSAAGRGGGLADERHLWPHWFHLISLRLPQCIVGEQVASKDGLAWLDLVHADLEAARYASGAVDACAAGFGAPHIRQRQYWMGHHHHPRLSRREQEAVERTGRWQKGRAVIEPGCASGGLAHYHHQGDSGRRIQGPREGVGSSTGTTRERPTGLRADGGMGDSESVGRQRRPDHRDSGRRERSPGQTGTAERLADDSGARAGRNAGTVPGPEEEARLRAVDYGAVADGSDRRPGPTNGFWRDPDWLFCRDGKWRPVKPGTFVLAHGQSSRVGRLRAYGNQVVRQQAAAWIEVVMEETAGMEELSCPA